MPGWSTNFACRSTSAANSLPSFTSFSVEPLILAMMPLLMLRFPIIAGSSFTDSGRLDPGVVVGTFLLASLLGSALAVSVLWVVDCGCCVVALSFVCAKLATDPASKEDVSNKAVTSRDKHFTLKDASC